MTTQVFHSSVNDVVPWQASYTFPTQSTKVHKQTVKLPPKQGGDFNATRTPIRIEFPSDGYLNPLQSMLTFDLTIASGSALALEGRIANTSGVYRFGTDSGASVFPATDTIKGWLLVSCNIHLQQVSYI